MDKEVFIEALKSRLKKIAVDTVVYLSNLQQNNITRVIFYQLTKSATSAAANYRAACRARSKAEFRAKMSITVEELDETLFWLEILEETKVDNSSTNTRLQAEVLECLKICAKARNTAQ